MEYFIYSIQYKNKWHHYLWYNDADSAKFLMTGNRICDFPSIDEALQYSRQKNLTINDENTKIRIAEALGQIDGVYYFDVWNLVTDFCNTLQMQFWGNNGNPDVENIYRKLFRANEMKPTSSNGARTLVFDHEEGPLLKLLYDGFLEIIEEVIRFRSKKMGQPASQPKPKQAETTIKSASPMAAFNEDYYNVYRKLRITEEPQPKKPAAPSDTKKEAGE